MRALVAALAILLCVQQGTLPVAAAQAPNPIVIDDDDGGPIAFFLMWYDRLVESHTPVVLRGICVSACTLVLMLPKTQVCVEPTASLGFHLASAAGKPLSGYTSALIRRYYPMSVRKWLVGKKLEEEPIYMTAAQIVETGTFPACEQ